MIREAHRIPANRLRFRVFASVSQVEDQAPDWTTPARAPALSLKRCIRGKQKKGGSSVARSGITALTQKRVSTLTLVPASLLASMNEGPVSTPLCFSGTTCVREVLARRHGCRRSPARWGLGARYGARMG